MVNKSITRSIRIDEHPRAIGFMVGRIRIRRYAIKRRDGQKEGRRLVYRQVYRNEDTGHRKSNRKPSRKPIYGYVDGFQASEPYLGKRGIRLMDVHRIPSEEVEKIKEALKRVLVGSISVSVG